MEFYAESRGKDMTPYFPRTGIFMCHHPDSREHDPHVRQPDWFSDMQFWSRASSEAVSWRETMELDATANERLETSITRGRAQRKAPEETVQIARTRQTQPLLMSTSTRVPLEERPSW